MLAHTHTHNHAHTHTFCVPYLWRVFSVKIRTLIHNFDEVGQKLYEVGQLVYEVGQLLDGIGQLLMVADRGIPKRAPDARYPNLVDGYSNPVGPLPNHVAKVQRFIGNPHVAMCHRARHKAS